MTDVAVVGIDPGGTTGVGVIILHEDSYELYGAYQFTDQDYAWTDIQRLVKKLRSEGYEVHLAIEQWDKRPGIVNPDYSAKFVERDIDNNVVGYAHKHKQTPDTAKNFIRPAVKNRGNGDALKRFGLYQTAKRHSNDALRHAITYAVVNLKHKTLIEKGWPRDD